MYFKYINRIELNTTELCNLKCSFCPRGHGYPNQNKHMSVATARTIREQLDDVGYKRYVSITGRGEPTLTNKFDEILDVMLCDAEYKTYMYTNGYKLDQFEQYIPLFWKVYVDVYSTSVDEYNEITDKYQQYDNVQVMHKPDTGEGYHEYNQKTSGRFSNRGGYMKGEAHGHNNPCAFVFNKLFINWNGDYNLCCDDWHEQIVMSNISEQTIYQYVEENETLAKYRHSHLTGGRCNLDVCRGCTRDYFLADNIYNKLRQHERYN